MINLGPDQDSFTTKVLFITMNDTDVIGLVFVLKDSSMRSTHCCYIFAAQLNV